MSETFSPVDLMNEIANLSVADKQPARIKKSAGDMILEEGNKGRFMFFVESGQAKFIITGQTVESVGPGGIIGEMALINNSAQSANVTAETDCQLIPISRLIFLGLVKKNPEFSLYIMSVMNQRLRAASELLGI